jgi:hypothetical protein
MIDSKHPADSEVAVELQRELRRLKSERTHAIAKRDQVYAYVETGDDTGHVLVIALEDLRRVEQRMEQVSHLLMKEQQH